MYTLVLVVDGGFGFLGAEIYENDIKHNK